MPAKQAYLIRRELDGTQRTVQASSVRGAMVVFLAEYKPEPGEEFRVKPRRPDNEAIRWNPADDWEYYRVTPTGGARKMRVS